MTNFLKRIISAGFKGFWRNGAVSLASVLVSVVTLLIVAFLVFGSAVLNFSFEQVKDRVDVAVSFVPSATEQDVLVIEKQILGLEGVEEVVYISKQDVLEDFIDAHANDSLTLSALEELGENPFGATLLVKANNPDNYDEIVPQLSGPSSLVADPSNSIERINYEENKDIIERLENGIIQVKKIGLGVSLFFIIISIIITFNTLRLAIYSSREEVEIMRLVGAQNHYIRGPFVVQGVLYGGVSALLTMIILYPITLWVSSKTAGFFGPMDIYVYYANNFGQLFFVLLSVGVLLGVLSSLLAIRKYLKK